MKRYLFCFLLIAVVKGEIYDISIPENDTASYNYADFRIWVNDSTDTLRGIYWFMHPNNGDSRDIVTDSAYQSLVDNQGFALLGAHIFNMHMSTGIGDAVLAAMDSFAVQTGHDEISFIPFFINGYSWGGQFGYHFTKWIPERVLGFITQKGGYHDTTDAGEAIEVPGLMVIAENDAQYRIDNLTGIFYDHRLQGAKWILAMEPDVAHTLVVDYPFLDSFFNTVTDLRLPSTLNVFEPVVLNIIPDSIGWFGNQNTYTIGSWNCYNDDIDSSSWFPSRGVGELWQNFVTDLPTDTSVCGPTYDSSYVFFTVGIHGEEDESNYTITTNNNDLINQCRSQLELPEDDRGLHINGYLEYGDAGFNQPWNWHIIPNEWVLAEMSIGVCNGYPEDIENDLDYWINTVGQLCNWGSFIKEEIETDQDTLYAPANFELHPHDSFVEILWSPVGGDVLEYYLLERSTDENFINNVHENYLITNSYEDHQVEFDTEYFYRVSYYAGEWSEYSEVLSITLEWMDLKNHNQLPINYSLDQNYPNPFNPTTQINYELPENSYVNITIFDILGNMVCDLVSQKESAGYKTIEWRATNHQGQPLSAGVYFYKIEAQKFIEVKKMILVK